MTAKKKNQDHEQQSTSTPTVEFSTDQKDIAEVCDGLRDFLLVKNAAYGSSALKPMRVFSRADTVEQIKVRLDDKISRLCRGHALPLESLADTVDDLMGYLVLLKIAVKRSSVKELGERL